MLCLCAAQLKLWIQTDLGRENSASYFRQGRQLLLTFLTMARVGHALRPFFMLIGHNFTGDFMWKIFAVSWNLFTLTAETDRVLCQLVMFLTVFFYWMYKMKFSCYQESSSCYSWLVCLMGFWLRNTSLVKPEIRLRMASFLFFTLLDT